MTETAGFPGPVPLEIPMDDGVTLAALRYPAPRPPAPAIVVLIPYRKESRWFDDDVRMAQELNCDYVVVDVRGLGGSGGTWDGPLSPREIADGVEVLEWLAGQEFSDGRTAMSGGSYCGINQLLIAARRPRGLVCIAPSIAPVDSYRDIWHRGGIPSHTNWGAMVAQRNVHRAGTHAEIVEDFYGHTIVDPLDNDRFRARSAEYVLPEIDVPVLMAGGWYDYFLRGTVRAFEGIDAPKRLLLGNWSHIEVLPDTQRSALAQWYAYWLCGSGDDPTEGDVVCLQRSDGEWEALDHWPSADEITWQTWDLVSQPTPVPVVTVIDEIAPTSESPVSIHYDLVTGSGMHLWGEAWAAQGEPVDRAMRYRGPVALSVRLASEVATDVDLHARLSVLGADGIIRQASEGRLRASHRALDESRTVRAGGQVVVPWHSHARSDPLKPKAPVTLDVELFPVNLYLAAGDALRIGMTLVRSDEGVGDTSATIMPGTAVRLPLL